MRRPVFKTTVRRVLGPSLQQHGFEEVEILSGNLVQFRREYRKFPNEILVESVDTLPVITGQKAARFRLYAPNYGLIGFPSGELPGGRNVWSYSTQAEWEACLEEMCSLVLEAGLPWFEIYTPGNVPDWKEWVEANALPVLTKYGFKRQKHRPLDMPDLPTFLYNESLDRMITFDLRFRGVVEVTFARRMMRDVVRQYSYETTGEFFTVLDEALDFVVSELPRWMAHPPL